MQRYSAEKAAWRILVGRSFDRSFSRLNRAHSPRPVLNGARPWNRVRGHSSCLPRFIPAFARRAVLLFPLHPPRNRTRHNYSASFLFGLFTLFSEPSRGFVEDFESRALDRLKKGDGGKKIRFRRGEEGWARRRFRFRVGHAREETRLDFVFRCDKTCYFSDKSIVVNVLYIYIYIKSMNFYKIFFSY